MVIPVESAEGADAKPAPRQAASALVLRPCAGGAEVLIVHRHPSLRFLGGYWVFPGGTLDPTDAGTPTTREKPTEYGVEPSSGVQRREDGGHHVDPPPALRVAAARELFEETGLLVATPGGSRPADPRQLPPTQQHEVSTRNTPGHFAELLRRQNAAIDLESFQPWAHWITPSALRRRFDTWFFIVAAPAAGQRVQVDGAEIDDVRWIQPVEWALGARIADFPVTPPTQLVLRELAQEIATCGSLDTLLAAAAARSVPAVLPKLIGGETGVVVLPWDPEYNELPGDGSPWDTGASAARSGWPSRLPAGLRQAGSA